MGDLLITSPDFSHTFASPAPLGFWWLGFQTGPRVATATHSDFPAIGAVKHELQVRYREQVDRDLADLSENLEIPRFAILHRMPQARRILKDIGEELREKHPHAHLMVHARLLELFTLVLRRFEASAAARPYPEIEYLKNHLEAHPDEAVSLSRMADLTGLSPFYISRRFREATGMPPVRFAMKVRMEHAKELLASGLAVGEVAAKCGFRDLFHFSRAFKGTVGMAPTRYARGADE
jgi:AraC-like DNA-binding protein